MFPVYEVCQFFHFVFDALLQCVVELGVLLGLFVELRDRLFLLGLVAAYSVGDSAKICVQFLCVTFD